MSAPGRVEQLRTLFLFEAFTDAQLEILSEKGSFERLPPGPLIIEGDPAAFFFVLVEGELVMSGRSGGADVETHRTSQRGVYCGAWNAYVAGATQRYDVSVRLTRESLMFVLAAGDFAHFMQTQFPIAVHLLGGHVLGAMRQQQLLGQRLRLLGLGAITAGLTHQLNNPAAAINRATAELRDSVAVMRHQVDGLADVRTSPETIGVLHMVQQAVFESDIGTEPMAPRTSMDIADREDAVNALVDDYGLRVGVDFAAVFAESGFHIGWLNDLLSRIAGRPPCDRRTGHLQQALDWLRCLIRTDACISEVSNASKRISTLLASAAQYSQMDRGDYQLADVHGLLDSTLTVCAPHLQQAGITVRREWDVSVPRIYCYAGDLNQVWTNLIENATDAMGASGTLTVRTTRMDDSRIAVTIADDGEGIPEDVIEHIFTPFFTTKTSECNVGLGLDLVWRIVERHGGSVSVTSRPARTEFTVTLPLQAPAPEIPLSWHRSVS